MILHVPTLACTLYGLLIMPTCIGVFILACGVVPCHDASYDGIMHLCFHGFSSRHR